MYRQFFMFGFITDALKQATLLLGMSTLAPAVVIVHNSGTTTYSGDLGQGSFVSVGGGEATFTGAVRTNTVVTVTDGVANFFGEIQNNAEFNLTGGEILIDTVKNNATLNVSGDAQLTLVQETGNTAILNLDGAGTLVLAGDNIFGNNAELNASGGSILTQGHSFEFWETNLSGSTVIDLGGQTGDFVPGDVTGEGEVIFTNWTEDTVITYDPGSGIDPASQILFDGAGTHTETGRALPIPEPGTPLIAATLALAGLTFLRRRS